MESPCVQVCVVDPASELCAGCGRSLEEIAGWTRMTDDERRRIMRRLSDRRRPAPSAAER